jgi:putative SOS response-associated peptidase YedK
LEQLRALFASLTTEPNVEVKAIHPKAVPAILTTAADVDAWLTAPMRWRCDGRFSTTR